MQVGRRYLAPPRRELFFRCPQDLSLKIIFMELTGAALRTRF